MATGRTRGERVVAFIHRYCYTPEGSLVGKPVVLDPFQIKFILDVYDNPHVTRMAILSLARKNGKTTLIACILLAHIAGPEAVVNSHLCSGAMSRDQAALVFKLASKIVKLSPELRTLIRITPSTKTLIGTAKNVEYRALSAEGKTNLGGSPALAILDEVGQVRGPQSDFVDAITTSQGAYENPLLIVISTQAPTDADLLSIWIDDAKASKDPHIVCHVYESTKDCSLLDEEEWKKSNPAIGKFRSFKDVAEQAKKAFRMPSAEGTFRNLTLNQRAEAISPFIARSIWVLNSSEVDDSVFIDNDTYVGIDLSGKTDLCSMVLVAFKEKWHVKAYFWTPAEGLRDRAKRDRTPYDVWVEQGFIRTMPGRSIQYDSVAEDIRDALEGLQIISIGFDRWRFDLLKKELDELAAIYPMEPFGQGFKDMSPAVDELETWLMNEQVAHGGNPVLTSCMNKSRVEKDAAGNRKLTKAKSTGRIDGAVALLIACGVATRHLQETDKSEMYVL